MIYSKLTNEQFKEKLKFLKTNQSAFSKEIGISSNTVKGWLQKNKIPKWVETIIDNKIKIIKQDQVIESYKIIIAYSKERA